MLYLDFQILLSTKVAY